MGKNKMLPKMSCQQVVLSAKASHRKAMLLETLAFRPEIKRRTTSLLAIEDPVPCFLIILVVISAKAKFQLTCSLC